MKSDCPIFDRVWDVTVVGSGAAGLMACLELPADLNILLLTKDSRARSASRWAQGGIAAALGPDDSTEAHFHDTLAAGAGLCEPLPCDCWWNRRPAVWSGSCLWGCGLTVRGGS